MNNYSVDNNRIIAFIYIEGEFFTQKFHTECVTGYLKEKKLINKDEELYLMLKDKKEEHIARKWIEQIENNCIFGELANYNNENVLIVFDELTELGKRNIKEKGFAKFGTKKILYAQYVGDNNQKFIFIEI